MIRVRLFLAIGVVACVALLNGCDKKPEPSGGTPVPGPQMQKPGDNNAVAVNGKGVFDAQGCVNCHAVGMTPAKGKGGAPDLGPIATNGKYTRDTLSTLIKNPPKKPYGGMPAYEGKINDAEMAKLLDFLLEGK